MFHSVCSFCGTSAERKNFTTCDVCDQEIPKGEGLAVTIRVMHDNRYVKDVHTNNGGNPGHRDVHVACLPHLKVEIK
jgi:ribosomal protein L24E